MRSVNICLVVLVVIVLLLINFWIILELKYAGSAKHSTKKHHHKIKDDTEKFPSEPVIPIFPDDKPEPKEDERSPIKEWDREKELEILKEKERQREREDEFERKRLEEHKKNHHHHRIHQHSHHGQHTNHSHHHTHIHTATTEKIETTTSQRGIVKEILEEINKNRHIYTPPTDPQPPQPTTTTPRTRISTTAHYIHHTKQPEEHLRNNHTHHGGKYHTEQPDQNIQRPQDHYYPKKHEQDARHNHTHHGGKHKTEENDPDNQKPQDQYYPRKHKEHHDNNHHHKIHHYITTTQKPIEPEHREPEPPKIFTEYGVRYPEVQEVPTPENREDFLHRTTQEHTRPTIAPTTTIIRTTMERIRVTPPPRRPFNPATFVPRIEVYRSNVEKNTDGALIYDITSTTTEKATTRVTTTMAPVEDRNDVHEWESMEEPEKEEPEPQRIPIVPIETTTLDTSTTYYSTSTSAEEDLYEEEMTTIGRIEEERPTTQLPVVEESAKKNEEDEITIVTAMIDIGRGDWWQYRRPLEKYHEFMENLLSLKNYMVIFTDNSSYDFIKKYRKNMGLIDKTKIHLITIDDLPLSRHLPYAQKIIEDELKNDQLYQHDPSMKNHPEAKSAEYDIVVNSKTYFLHNATLEDPFGSDFFVWIDAGYGHGNASVFPYDAHWKPKFPKGKISMIKLTPAFDPINAYRIDNLYRRNWSVVSGGFIAGDKRTLGQLYTIVSNKFIHLIYQNKVDDDQTVMVLAINSYPHLFNIQHGDWFDAFRLFSSDPERQFG